MAINPMTCTQEGRGTEVGDAGWRERLTLAVTFDLLGGALGGPSSLVFLLTPERGEAGIRIPLPGHPFTRRLIVFRRGQWFCFQCSWRPLLGRLELLCGPQRRGRCIGLWLPGQGQCFSSLAGMRGSRQQDDECCRSAMAERINCS